MAMGGKEMEGKEMENGMERKSVEVVVNGN